MPFFDLSLDELQKYTPTRNEPADFDAFWQATLSETRKHPLDAQFKPHETGLALVESFDVTFRGFGGQPIKGWLNLPRQRSNSLPCVVEYIGYGGGRGLAQDWLFWAAAGYAHFIMDTRGQGSSWSRGDTPDSEPDGGSPQYPGFMTRGILEPKTYYYRRLFTDAVRAVEAAAEGAERVTLLLFDLHHVRAQVGQQHRRRRPGDEGAVLDHAHAGEDLHAHTEVLGTKPGGSSPV